MATQQVQQRAAGGIAYTLTRRRVRNINLRVRADGSVAASASARVPAAYVDAFVAARADWVRAAQQRAAARRAQEAEQPDLPPPPCQKYICNIVHAFTGKCKQKGGHAARCFIRLVAAKATHHFILKCGILVVRDTG